MPDVIDLSATEAKAVLEKEKQDRVDACSNEVKASLEKYNCSFVTQVTLIGTNIIPQVLIQPNETKSQN